MRAWFSDTPVQARCIRPDHTDARPSMVIYEDNVYCFGCGSYWWPDQFLAELGERPIVTMPVKGKPARPVRFIPKSMVLTFNRWLLGPYSNRLEWLYARGLRLEDAIMPNLLGYDGSAFVIPIMDGDLVTSLRFRRDDAWGDDLDDEQSPKYWGLPGKNEITLYKPVIPAHVSVKSDVILLCEGELDALRLSQEGFIAWSLTNGCRAFRPEHIKEFSNRELKILYDQDTPGRVAAQRVSGMTGAKVVQWPEVLGKDVTEFLQRWSLQAFLKQI